MTHAQDKFKHSLTCINYLNSSRATLGRAHEEAIYAGDTISASRIQSTMDFLFRAHDSLKSFHESAVREMNVDEEKETV